MANHERRIAGSIQRPTLSPLALVEQAIDKVVRDDAEQIARDAETYKRLGRKLGYVSLNTGGVCAYDADEMRKKGKAVYSGKATNCVVAGFYDPRYFGIAHFNPVTRNRLIDRGLEDMRTLTLAQAEAQNRRLMNDKAAAVRSIVSREQTEQTALETLRAAADTFTQLSQGDIPVGTRLLVGGAFHLLPEEVPVVEAFVRQHAQGFGIDPRHVTLNIGHTTGLMFGFPKHRNFPGIGFYDMTRFKKISL